MQAAQILEQKKTQPYLEETNFSYTTMGSVLPQSLLCKDHSLLVDFAVCNSWNKH